MRSLLLSLLSVLFVASCATTSPVTPEPKSPCPEATAQLRRNSCVAIKERTPVGVMFAWLDRRTSWPKGPDGMVRLSVRFVDGDNTQISKAWKRIQLVDDIAEGLEVRRAVEGEVSDVRVSFSCQGHWSYLGKGAKQFPGQVTLNAELKRWDSAEEWDRVFIHEFLHAVGFEHEHQHPNHSIAWDREAVYRFYAENQGWDRDMVDFQVLNRGAPVSMLTSGYDSTSIMQYPVPQELTLDDFEVAWNTKLSPSDIELIRKLFPAPPLAALTPN